MSVLNDKILQQHFQRKHREEMQLTPLIQLEGPGQHSPHPLSPKEMTCLRLSSNERHAQKKNITNIYIYIWLHNDEANKRMITPLDNLALRNVWKWCLKLQCFSPPYPFSCFCEAASRGKTHATQIDGSSCGEFLPFWGALENSHQWCFRWSCNIYIYIYT